LEEKALSSNRKVVLVIDDEVRKLEDLFLSLMDHCHIVYAYNAEDAFSKLQARPVDLAIVDMQIGSGGLWGAAETGDFKGTGRLICQRIFGEYPATKVGVLTGTRYSVKDLEGLQLAFFLRKTVDPAELTARVRNVLG
jgi:DNA-binding response OmpR family regulator